MDETLAKAFFAKVVQSLGFLVSEHGFSEPRFKIDDRIHFAYASFERSHLALECSCDQRDEHVDCHVVRLGVPENVDALERKDRPWREGVYQWVKRHGGRDPLFSRPQDLSFPERIPIKLDDYAEMLKRYGGPILADDPTALD
ncbi:MAG TPA: hypothetical protein VNT81_14960 [Vicinamibacterales bacterium]|nr:hypothetical protein [Vicinamibacterales bacterium]